MIEGEIQNGEIQKREGRTKVANNLERVKALMNFCFQKKNPIVFVDDDYGENFDLDNLEIKPEVFESIDKTVGTDSTLFWIKNIKSYLNGPTFVDTFAENHGTVSGRRKWEQENELLMGQDLLKYYNSNKLGLTNCFQVVQSLDMIINDLNDSEIKNKLLKIKEEAPIEITRKNKDGEPLYSFLGDREKIRIVGIIGKIAQDIVSVLEKPKTKATE